MKYKHILVATDLLDGHEQLIARADELAKDFGARLSLVHVVESLPGYGYAFISPAEIETQLMDEAKKEIDKKIKDFNIAAEDVHVVLGPTKVEIIDIAEEKQVDLIVVGTHHKHGLGHLLGSTANAVIHGAPCDVLTARVGGKD
jgi:universal stress protein A